MSTTNSTFALHSIGNGMKAAHSLYGPPDDQKDKSSNFIAAYYVLQYSPSQRSFHIEPLHEMIANNAKSFARDRLNDYSPIAMARSRKRLEHTAKLLRSRGN